MANKTFIVEPRASESPGTTSPTQRPGVSYFSITAFTLSATVKSYLVTLTLSALSNDCSLVTAFLWEPL